MSARPRSTPPVDHGWPCWLPIVIIFGIMASVLFWGAHERLLPNEDDCEAQGRAPDCWMDKPVFDELGRLVR